jgi:hypothetical protein
VQQVLPWYGAGMEKWRRFEAYLVTRTGWPARRVSLVLGGLMLVFLWMMFSGGRSMLPGSESRPNPALWGSTGKLAPNGVMRTSDFEAGRIYVACMQMNGDPAIHQLIVSKLVTPQAACSCAAHDTWQGNGGETSEPEGNYRPVSEARVVDFALSSMRRCL